MTPRRSRYWAPPLGPRARPAVPEVCKDGGATAPTHTHQLPRIVVLALAGLAAVNVFTLVAVGLLAVYVYQDHQYVQGRGQYRDAEATRLEREMRDLACGLLDTLPADNPVLGRARDKYGCGPGLPFDQLPPDVQRNFDARWTFPTIVPGGGDTLPGAERPGGVQNAEPPAKEGP